MLKVNAGAWSDITSVKSDILFYGGGYTGKCDKIQDRSTSNRCIIYYFLRQQHRVVLIFMGVSC